MAGKLSFSELINNNEKPVLVDFHAEWCGPCKMMSPILNEVKSSLGDKIKIIKVDIDKNPEGARQYQVQGVPTLVIFSKGQILWRQSGVVPAQQLIEILKQYV